LFAPNGRTSIGTETVVNLGIGKKSRKKAEEAPLTGDEFIDPAEQVRRRLDKSIDIGSPLLYPF
jgi:hypothetical protein